MSLAITIAISMRKINTIKRTAYLKIINIIVGFYFPANKNREADHPLV
jgi:hypothetical protein